MYLLVLLSGQAISTYHSLNTDPCERVSTVIKFFKSKIFFEFPCVFQVASGQISSERLSLLVRTVNSNVYL